MRARIIANPNAGSFEAAQAAIRRAAADADCELCLTQKPGDAAALARESLDRGDERVIAGGGDGTLHEVVNGLGANAPIGVGLLPLGTGNDFARGVGIPLADFERALDIALHAPLTACDLVRCVTPSGESLVVNAAAGGLNEAIHDEVDAAIKKQWGPIAYFVSAAKQTLNPPVFALRLRVGDRSFAGEAHAIAVANANTIGGGLPIAPSASPSDGQFNVYVLPRQSTGALLTAGVELLLGAHEGSPSVIVFAASRLEVEVEPAMRFHLDGEGVEAQRAVFTTLAGAMRFAAPPDDAETEAKSRARG